MTTVSTRAVLSFLTADNQVARFSVPRARFDKTAGEAAASMDALLNTGALAFTGKDRPVAIHGAKIVRTARTQIA